MGLDEINRTRKEAAQADAAPPRRWVVRGGYDGARHALFVDQSGPWLAPCQEAVEVMPVAEHDEQLAAAGRRVLEAFREEQARARPPLEKPPLTVQQNEVVWWSGPLAAGILIGLLFTGAALSLGGWRAGVGVAFAVAAMALIGAIVWLRASLP